MLGRTRALNRKGKRQGGVGLKRNLLGKDGDNCAREKEFPLLFEKRGVRRGRWEAVHGVDVSPKAEKKGRGQGDV